MPSDRHAEGLAGGLTVRENASFAALDRFATYGILSRAKELTNVGATFKSLAVKTPTIEAPILSLSGGNQQKVVMARALLSEPRLIVADEPTQGVDVGARAEIYRILREVSSSGTPVVVNSSDAAELEGLCDQVIVMSRGHAVETLSGADVSKPASSRRRSAPRTSTPASGRTPAPRTGGLRHLVQTDNAPAVPLAIVTILLALYVFSPEREFPVGVQPQQHSVVGHRLGLHRARSNHRDLARRHRPVGRAARRISGRGGFVLHQRRQIRRLTIAAGFALILLGAVVVGGINGVLIRFANFTPIAATLAMYIGLQGMSFLLRDNPGGYINGNVVGSLRRSSARSPSLSSPWWRSRSPRIRAAPDAVGLAASGDRFE